MSRRSEVPFDNIESSHEYVTLLAEAIAVALSEVESDIAVASGVDERRKEALRLVAFKLNKLSTHMASSRRILNDLRTLRRLLFEERSRTAILNRDEESERHFVAVTK
jgi:hypothetical protein